ncbi:MAG: SatD family protein [Acidimicrobiia bacterium]
MSSTGRRNWAAVIGDVVGSRQATSRSRLQQRLDKALAAVNAAVKPVQPLTPTIGDEFQGMFERIEEAMEASFRLRVELVGKVDVRIGIGWGTLRTEDPSRTPFGQDGPCWWRAREALQELARTERSNQEPNSLRTVCRTGTVQEPVFNAILVLRDQILSGIDEDDATILRLLIGGASQQDAASRLDVNKSSVSRRMQSHGLAALLRSREHLARPA